MTSVEEVHSSPSSSKLTPKENLISYVRSLPLESFTRSSWASRQNLSLPSSEDGESRKELFCSSSEDGESRKELSRSSSGTSTSVINACLRATNAHTLGNPLPDPSPLPPKQKLSEKRHLIEIPNPELQRESLNATRCVQSEEDIENIDRQFDVESQIVLSICFSHDKLGAAFYDASTSQAYVMEDKAENPPEFWVLKALVMELSPKILLCGGKQDERLFKVIKQLREDGRECSHPDTDEGSSKSSESAKRKRGAEVSDTDGDLPSSGRTSSDISSSSSQYSFILSIRPTSEFKYDSSRRKILLYPWPGLARHFSDFEKEAWVGARVDLKAVGAVRALGGLLRFLDQKRNQIISRNSASFCETSILGLHPYRMEDLVHVDLSTIEFLQVFVEDLHPANSKKGKSSASKEGLSLFALLSRTASPLSPELLRRIILRPVRNSEILKSRYDFLSWALQPANFDTIRQIQSCLKNIANVQMLFARLQRSQLNVQDWKTLYKSLFNMILLSEICATQDQRIDALREVKENACEDLYHATYLIQRTLDFDQAEREGRFVVKPGVDQDLDDNKRKFSSLPEIMNKVGQLELAKLPQEIESCCVIYLPHVGYLLAIPPSSSLDSFMNITNASNSGSLTVENYDIPGLQFVFSTTDMVLFKSALCSEMDVEMGDLQVVIANRETSIMMRLVEVLLLQSHAFVYLVSKTLMIDVLLALASVSRDFGWVRPSINIGGTFRVKEGRHPLYEMCNPTFVSNDIMGDVSNTPLTLITGPNASGKTAFVRQVGVIAYLAHLGCFVPAEEMSFSPFDAIFAVAIVTPSVTSGLSSFMVELNRLSVTVLGATSKSLVLIDEFGLSTCNYDGASLLAATFDFWMSQHAHADSSAKEFTEKEGQPESGGAETSQPPEETVQKTKYPKVPEDSSTTRGCPLVFATTHFYTLFLHLRHPNLVRELCMDTISEGGKVIHLYQAVEGRSKFSYAIQVALETGLATPTIERAKEISECLMQKRLPDRWFLLDNAEERKRCSDIVDLFINCDFNATSLSDLLSSIRKYLDQSACESLSESTFGTDLETPLPNLPRPFSSPQSSGAHILPSQGFRSTTLHNENTENSTVPNVCTESNLPRQMDGKTMMMNISPEQNNNIAFIKAAQGPTFGTADYTPQGFFVRDPVTEMTKLTSEEDMQKCIFEPEVMFRDLSSIAAWSHRNDHDSLLLGLYANSSL